MTIYNLVKTIKAYCTNLPNISYVEEGDVYQLNSKGDIDYPAIIISQTQHRGDFDNDNNVFGFNIFAVDRLTSDNDNKLDIQSWAKEILEDICSFIEEMNIGMIYGEIIIQPFTERFESECAGAYATLNIQIDNIDCEADSYLMRLLKLIKSAKSFKNIDEIVGTKPNTLLFYNGESQLVYTVKCVISNVTADDVEADATSAIIKYDCNVTTITYSGVSTTVVTHKEKTVTFEANESEDDVIRTGSFTCEHGETVEWSVVQKGKVPMPSDNEIWYKTNDSLVIVPKNMSPKTNTYTDKGVMTFEDNVTSIVQSAFANKSTLTEFYGGMSLANVGSYAFMYCTSLTSVNLPNCTSVANAAFVGCSSLSKFTGLMATEDNRCLMSNGTILAFAPAGLTSYTREDCTSVGSYAFYDCTSLTSIDLPSCTTIGYSAFEECTSLSSVNLPNCTTVSYYAFYNCISLTSIDLPSCTTVGYGAFEECTSLSNVNLPNCTTVSNEAFDRCTSLTSVNLSNCTTVSDYAFAFCSSLPSIDLPSCTTVGYGAFQDCTSLTSVNLPVCTSVGSWAFNGCSSLTSIDLPNCTSVSTYAFAFCSSLPSIDLPNCTTVGSSAFYACRSLTSVTLGASTMCVLSNSNAFGGCSKLTSIYVTPSLVDTYKADSIWSWYSSKIVPIA